MALTKHSNLELIDLPDCTALLESGGCSRLDVPACKGHDCPFKRSQVQERRAVCRSMARLESLDGETQARIAGKYYGGRQIWKERGAAKGELGRV